jgi:hypothetical protein
MKQQPDKIFRDKLAGYQKAAPADAWSRIDAGLSKKNNATGLWLKIAASLLILAIATFMLWPEHDTAPGRGELAQEKQVQPDATLPPRADSPANENPADKREEKPVLKGKENPAEETERKPPIVRKEKKKSIQPKPAAEQNNVAQQQPPVTAEDLITDNPQAIAATQEEPVAAENEIAVSPEEDNIKLVFSAGESDDYLNKKSLAEATSHDKKPSTLKKLLKKAEGLATNQDPFGELRQKKNEILALNFKNDKQRGQNK